MNGEQIICFGDFELSETVLRRCGVRVTIEPTPLRILHLLISRAPRIVTKKDLVREIWGEGVSVERGTIDKMLWRCRKALGDSAAFPRYVQTIARIGYRWVAPITNVHAPRRRHIAGRRRSAVERLNVV